MGILITAPTRRDPATQPSELEESEDATCPMHIREVARITGLGRQQLSVWERRYNFPTPLRDAFGDRVYPPEQVARLKLIKQLLSEGWRAGTVVPLAESALRLMLGLSIEAPAPMPDDVQEAASLLAEHRIGDLQNQLSKLLIAYGLRNFLERTLIPLNEAVHDRVVRGEMQSFQELRFADVSLRLLRDVTRLVRPSPGSRQILLATPPNDPNPLGLAILELLLFTEGIKMPHSRAGCVGAGSRRGGARL
jgi:DNA-binding transcriptional MerR regulator